MRLAADGLTFHARPRRRQPRSLARVAAPGYGAGALPVRSQEAIKAFIAMSNSRVRLAAPAITQ